MGVHNAGCRPAIRRGKVPEPGNLSQDRDRCAALPVWFAQDVLHGAWAIIDFYFYSEASAGKLKRIMSGLVIFTDASAAIDSDA